jgi:hypothetical protein
VAEAVTTYTKYEAVQIRLKGQKLWRNGTVSGIKQKPGFLEITVEYKSRGKTARLVMDAASPFLRKWREGVIEKTKKPKKKRQPVRYQRAMPRVK